MSKKNEYSRINRIVECFMFFIFDVDYNYIHCLKQNCVLFQTMNMWRLFNAFVDFATSQ